MSATLTLRQLIQIVEQITGCSGHADTTLEELRLDSLDVFELAADIEDETGIEVSDFTIAKWKLDTTTLQNVCDSVNAEVSK